VITAYVNGEKIKTNVGKWICNDTSYSRNYTYVGLKKGKNKIQNKFSSNVVFFGLAIKKYDIWTASKINNKINIGDKLQPINIETSTTSTFDISTLKCDFMYYHGLDEILAPIDVKTNCSDLYLIIVMR
jgi:hypothetical protein